MTTTQTRRTRLWRGTDTGMTFKDFASIVSMVRGQGPGLPLPRRPTSSTPPSRPPACRSGAAFRYGPAPRQAMDIWRPQADATGLPVVVFFYGGAWQSGRRQDYPFVAATLARRGMVVAVPDYRLFPQVRVPGVHRGRRARGRRRAGARRRSWGGDPDRVFARRPLGGRLYRRHAGARPALAGRGRRGPRRSGRHGRARRAVRFPADPGRGHPRGVLRRRRPARHPAGQPCGRPQPADAAAARRGRRHLLSAQLAGAGRAGPGGRRARRRRGSIRGSGISASCSASRRCCASASPVLDDVVAFVRCSGRAAARAGYKAALATVRVSALSVTGPPSSPAPPASSAPPSPARFAARGHALRLLVRRGSDRAQSRRARRPSWSRAT